jgi:hypothetical protein
MKRAIGFMTQSEQMRPKATSWVGMFDNAFFIVVRSMGSWPLVRCSSSRRALVTHFSSGERNGAALGSSGRMNSVRIPISIVIIPSRRKTYR